MLAAIRNVSQNHDIVLCKKSKLDIEKDMILGSQNLPIVHLTSAILNATRTLEVGINLFAVSVFLADIHRMATCRQGIDGVRIRLCKIKQNYQSIDLKAK